MAKRQLISLLFILSAFLCATQMQAGTISGFVWADQNTNGLQDAGEPGMANIWVGIYIGNDQYAATLTDNNGNYAFPTIPDGTYRVKFSNPGGMWQSVQDIGTDDAIDSDADGLGFTSSFNLAGGQTLDFDAGFTTSPTGCFTPITITVTNVVCNNNGTPGDPSDDTFTFDLTASGGTGAWGWDFPPNIFMYPYDTPYHFGPFQVSSGPITITINDHDNPFCTATVTVDAPPCSTGPLPEIDFSCSPPVLVSVNAGQNTTVVNYTAATATTTCPGGAVNVTLTQGLPSGSAFPLGVSQVCYMASDNCGNTATCCFSVTVQDAPPCDVKIACSGCLKFELLTITKDPEQNRTYRIRVTNSCASKLNYVAFQVPDGVVAMAPANNSVYTAPSGNQYDVRNPNFSPFYSVRFKVAADSDSISGGESDIFEYTLPAQSNPLFIHVIARVSPKVFCEAHLNTFACVQGNAFTTTPDDFSDGNVIDGAVVFDEDDMPAASGRFTVFPNPTAGLLFADLSPWAGQAVQLTLLNAQGQRVQMLSATADQTPQAVQLGDLPAGLYYLQVLPAQGQGETQQFMLKR